jgi:hypothetical protein
MKRDNEVDVREEKLNYSLANGWMYEDNFDLNMRTSSDESRESEERERERKRGSKTDRVEAH